jgi:Ca2+-binding RTX toxin-like protein
VRIGGDHIIITGGGGPNSPLVVYGDTSQDGVWYSGRPDDTRGIEFGEKPFNPFPLLADGDNEDDEWVFPVANPYRYAGHDIIDAGALFASTPGNALPSIGLTIYGGAGNDLIIGSQASDHLAGGSGDDTILGQRGADHIYGDSGVNVDILTRTLTIVTSDASPGPTLGGPHIRFINNGTTIQPYPSPVRDLLVAGRDTLYGEGAGTKTDGLERLSVCRHHLRRPRRRGPGRAARPGVRRRQRHARVLRGYVRPDDWRVAAGRQRQAVDHRLRAVDPHC